MHEGNRVNIFYDDITVGDLTDPGQMITVGTDTTVDQTSTTYADLGADATPGTRTGGDVKQRDGSGKLTINPSAVQADSRNVTFTFSYEFATKMTDAWLTVALPDSGNNLFVMEDAQGTVSSLTTLSLTGGAGVHGYARDPGSVDGDNPVLVGTGAVKWKIVGEKTPGSRVNRSISQMRVSRNAGVTEWRVYLTAMDPATSLPANTTVRCQ